MAKKKPGPPPKDEQKTLKSDDLRAMAEELADIAGQLSRSADDMDALRIESLSPLIGNWNNGIALQRGWIAKQLLPRLMSEANDIGAALRVSITDQMKK